MMNTGDETLIGARYASAGCMGALSPQRGAVLLFGLILLLALTVIGVSSMQGTVFEEKMAGNARDRDIAFQAAESALRDGELWLSSQVSKPVPGTTNGVDVWKQPALGGGAWWSGQSKTWWAQKGRQVSGINGYVAGSPIRVVEHDVFVPDSLSVGSTNVVSGVDYYRVTARAVGSSEDSLVLLQSMYARRF